MYKNLLAIVLIVLLGAGPLWATSYPRVPLPTVETLDITATDVTVANTTTETSVYSFSVPAGTLRTSNKIRVKIIGRASDASGGGDQTLTVRLKYGATTLVTETIGIDTGSTDRSYRFTMDLAADAGTGAQSGSVKLITDAVGIVNPASGYGSATEDSTTTLTLDVTVQWDLADATLTYTMEHAESQLIRD